MERNSGIKIWREIPWNINLERNEIWKGIVRLSPTHYYSNRIITHYHTKTYHIETMDKNLEYYKRPMGLNTSTTISNLKHLLYCNGY
jgi:hypothetical protein